MRDRHLPGHYAAVIAMILAFSVIAVFATLWALPPGPAAAARGRGSSSCSAPASCCSRRRRSSSSRCCGDRPGWWPRWRSPRCSTWRWSANFVVSRVEIRAPGVVGVALVALLALNYAIPIGRITFESRALESLFYARARVQPDPVRRAPVRIGDQALDVGGARLRHQPARRDGRRRRRVCVARDRLPRAAVRHRRRATSAPCSPAGPRPAAVFQPREPSRDDRPEYTRR